MAMRCPNCGAENPDNASCCVTCAERLKDETVLMASSQDEAPLRMDRSLRGSPLSIASLALTIALVLLSLGFVLYVYYIEGWMLNSDRDYETLTYITKAMYYSSQLGDLAAIVGLIFIVQALLTHPSRAAMLARILKARLSLVKWMLILTAVLLAIGLSVYFSVSELNAKFDYGVFLRLYIYAAQIAWIVAAAALLTFTLALRNAEKSNH